MGMGKGRVQASSLGSAPHYANLSELPERSSPTPYSVDGAKSAWVCGSCTMENWGGDAVCRACRRSRGAPQTQFSTTGESKRVCPTCTFENPPGCRSCEVCEVLLPQDVHTYV
ncbi:hypothetical protein ACOMHN_007007 [Nucella lapillus]